MFSCSSFSPTNKMSCSILHKLNLPSSLEALEKSIGLPVSLLGKAEEVRLNRGPERIEKTIRDIQSLSQRNAEILDQAHMTPFTFQ
jgi:programmed cell death 6-interacting protein